MLDSRRSFTLLFIVMLFTVKNTLAQHTPASLTVEYTVSARTVQQLQAFGERMRIAQTDTGWLAPFRVRLDYDGVCAVSYLSDDAADSDISLKAAIYTGISPSAKWWQQLDTAFLFEAGVVPLSTTDHLVMYPYRAFAETHGDWEETGEQKTILGYLCQKAIRTEYSYSMQGDSLVKGEVIAWFCPDLPYSHGPAQYGGLPGLILEMHGSRTIFEAVLVNLDDQVSVPAMPDGERISPKAFAITRSEAYHRFMEVIKKDN